MAARAGVRIGIAHDFDQPSLARFRAISPAIELASTSRSDQAAIDELATGDLDGLVGAGLPSDPGRTPSLRWLQVLSAGVEGLVGHGQPWPAGITLTNARGAYATSIGQYTIGAILRVAERVDRRREQQLRGEWPSGPEAAFLGDQVRGRTLTVVGYGGIGREIARLAVAHGMRVLAVKADPSVSADDSYRVPGTGDPEGALPERIVGVDGLREAVGEADFVSVTLPLTARSRGVVSRDVLAALRPDAWIINTGRGPVIDEIALAEVLAAGRIGGAVLDVFGEEPLPASSPFWRLANVIITPHVSGASSEALGPLVAENLRRFVDGRPLINRVDPARGY